MFGHKHYVPCMKWRQGEYGALDELADTLKSNLTPLIDIPSIPWDFEEERDSKSIDDHLRRIPDQMERAWGTDHPIFVDMGLLDEALRMASGAHPVEDLFSRLSAKSIEAIPVTGPNRGTAYQRAIRRVVAAQNRGVCVRIGADDLDDPSDFLEVLQDLELDRAEMDLVIDLKSIDVSQAAVNRRFLTSELRALSYIADYRTLTVLTGAFPLNLSGVSPGTTLLPRGDWTLWLGVIGTALPRLPSFGDYTAAHPEQVEVDPRIMQASASIRYAADTDWVILKGRSVRSAKGGGYGQFNTLSSTLIRLPSFTGHSFSWASDFIEQCAAGGQTGNLTTWRKVATNRHLVRTLHQIANLP